MQLIGMLDSPYVRRVAISLQLLGLPFEHRSVSVFRGFDEFKRINPVVKAPTLVCDDGTVLMDSSLIVEYAEALAAPRSLMPRSVADWPRTLRLTGLALASYEKCAQLVYEYGLRPAEKWHAPWIARVQGQLAAAFDGIETGLSHAPLDATTGGIDQAGVCCGVAWTFVRAMQPDLVDPARYPRLLAHAIACEQLPAFSRAPHGDGVVAR